MQMLSGYRSTLFNGHDAVFGHSLLLISLIAMTTYPPADVLRDLFPFVFAIDRGAITGATLWALALYLAFSPVSDWVIVQLTRWFNFAERSLYLSQAEFEKTRKGRESQNAFWASMFSVIPFVAVGTGVHYGIKLGLGDNSWSISLGIMSAVGSAVYELGRRNSQASESE
jgi:hypothetical protein